MPTDRFTNITLGTNLTGTDNADGSITIDATGGGGGGEVAYAQITASPANPTATVEASANAIITAPAFTADGTTDYLIEFFTPGCRPASGAANRQLNFWLFQDGSSIGEIGVTVIPVSGVQYLSLTGKRKLTPAAGSRTYSIRCTVNGGTDATILAGAGGAGNYVPAFLRITEA